MTAISLTGCSGGEEEGETVPADAYPREAVELIAPAGPGSGYDLTIRAIAQCLSGSGQVEVPLPVTNKPGPGGRHGAGVSGWGEGGGRCAVHLLPAHMPGAFKWDHGLQLRGGHHARIARLLMDSGCSRVRGDSPYRRSPDVMEALKEDPGALKIGGTSAAWSMDHIQFLIMAEAAGVSGLDQIEYEGYEKWRGGGQPHGRAHRRSPPPASAT